MTRSSPPFLPPDGASLARAADCVRGGGLIAFPTETVYGLGADPHNPSAIDRLFDAKGREPAKAVLLLVSNPRELSALVTHVPPAASALMHIFWPGPLTLVFRARPGLSPELLGGGQTLGIRLSSASVVHGLLDRLGGPITGTSANLSGAPPARSASEVATHLGDRVDLILDGGPAQEERPSTVVDVSGREVLIAREGAIPSSQVWRALGVDAAE